ncbi:MAG: proline--tRNA ligase [Candidatus Diapherotrites archaeon]|nr:proline--tRNA ligase [Candidatus Diapherotrites archaeon]
MAKKDEKGITVAKEKNLIEWYNQVVTKAELADFAPIHGFMVIRPNGYAIWEKIQQYFDNRIKKLGVRNAYFPLLIPERFFVKEAEHAEGFEPEVAWLERQNKKEEKLAIRPTSETIIYDIYSKWIRSWRDLPLLINQWCNVVRWEIKQTRLFLRTREFLWQEGHCAFATAEEAKENVLKMLEEYAKLCEELLAIPVIKGKKSEFERFAGAVETYTIEALMPDGKALQMGTSHFLGQNFSKAFEIKFVGKDEKEHYVWQSCWGATTRLIGAVILVHGDNKGLVLPPKIAERKAVIVPIIFEKDKEKVIEKCKEIEKKLKRFNAFADLREEYTAGWKFNEWELKGIPIRVEIGPKEVKEKTAVVVIRDTNEKKTVKEKDIVRIVEEELNKMQKRLFEKAKKFLEENVVEAKSWAEFKKAIKERKMVLAPFCNTEQCEEKIQEETKATSRCIPLNQKEGKYKCIKCGREARIKAYFARGY